MDKQCNTSWCQLTQIRIRKNQANSSNTTWISFRFVVTPFNISGVIPLNLHRTSLLFTIHNLIKSERKRTEYIKNHQLIFTWNIRWWNYVLSSINSFHPLFPFFFLFGFGYASIPNQTTVVRHWRLSSKTPSMPVNNKLEPLETKKIFQISFNFLYLQIKISKTDIFICQ